MIIEITEPEIEAMIAERLASGTFQSPQQVLIEALRSFGMDATDSSAEQSFSRTGLDIVAAMQASPHKEINLESPRYQLQFREVDF